MKSKTKSTAKLTTIDEYLTTVGTDQRAALQSLRQTIRTTAPKLEECMSYGLPSFRLNGKFLMSFGAAATHCAFYPGSIVQAHQKELEKYDTSKGTIRFQPEHPLPATLVRKLVKGRIAARLG